jgi:hypothetical protein
MDAMGAMVGKGDRIDHGKHHARAKKAMADMGHHNMTYHDGGER